MENKTVEIISEEQLREKVGSKIFHITFLKLDGSIRKMVARFEVKKGVLFTDRKKSETALTVYDMQKRAFRSIRRDKIISVSCGEFKWELGE